MRAASLDSPRLQRVLALLRDGRSYTTRQIVRGAHVMAVNSCISELRQHGAVIDCELRVSKSGARRHYYTMTKGPEDNG